mgnify:CR=1 FL=1
MKIQIRNGTFETNSSSTHSVTIKTDCAKKYLVDADIYPGEFGWGYEVLRTPSEKLSYILTHMAYKVALANNFRLNPSSIISRMKNLRQYKWIMGMIEEKTGHSVNFIPLKNPDELFSLGYIDHQSIGVLDFILDTKIKKEDFIRQLESLIFGTGSYIVIDNDNHD